MFEIIDHTADAGVIARGATLAEAFAEAARGMYSLMVDLDTVTPRESRDLTLRAPDDESLLIAWLLELNYLTETQGLLFSQFDVTELEDSHLRATVAGEPIDPNRHTLGVAVKAVTRHLLEIAREDGAYRLRVIFDI